MRRLTDVSHLIRWFDPVRYRTHRNALLLAAAAALAAFGVDTRDLGGAVSTGGAALAAWTIGREIDPDRPRSAVVAAVLAALAGVFVGTPAAAPLFVVLVTTRLVTRTTGLPPKMTDLAAVTAGTILFAHTPWGWAAGIVLAFAMVRDAALPGEPPHNPGLWGLGLAVGVTIRVALAGALGRWPLPDSPEWVVLLAGVVTAAVVTQPEPVLAFADWTKEPLQAVRLRESRIFAAASALLAFVAAGGAGVIAFAPLLLCFVAIAVERLFLRPD